MLSGQASCPCCRQALAKSKTESPPDLFYCKPCNDIDSFDLKRGRKLGGGDGQYSRKAPTSVSGIWTACSDGDLMRVKHHVQNRGVSPNILDVYGQSPLHKACANDHAHIAQYLLDQGANPDATGCGATALVRCASWSSLRCMKALLESGANVHFADTSFQDGRSALHKACDAGHVACVELLLQHAADHAQQDSRGDTPLEVAIQSGHVSCVRVLWNRTTQQVAHFPAGLIGLVELGVRFGQVDVVRHLLEIRGVGTLEHVAAAITMKIRLEEKKAASDAADHKRGMKQQADAWKARELLAKDVVMKSEDLTMRNMNEGGGGGGEEKEKEKEEDTRSLKVSILRVSRRSDR